MACLVYAYASDKSEIFKTLTQNVTDTIFFVGDLLKNNPDRPKYLGNINKMDKLAHANQALTFGNSHGI